MAGKRMAAKSAFGANCPAPGPCKISNEIRIPPKIYPFKGKKECFYGIYVSVTGNDEKLHFELGIAGKGDI